MKALLSIKPQYVDEIIKGKKKYEFRKKVFKKENEVKEIYIYSSSPVKKIVGYFKVNQIIEDHPQALWENFKEVSGINELEFFEYFKERETGFAIQINQLEVFENPVDPNTMIPNFVAPQSFRYMDEINPDKFTTLDSFGSK
ncbi:MAG: ASCH domain-containing protein [Methanobacterium sp.]|nr:ASCH domain-containing protein [Euryarchaeota archaeon]MBV1729642.1 ASCH domain-containing protein [Methanobacterium sp.]MBV1754850.1 ASCH domain-containing protein [Methanobacterium sp.]